MKMMCASVIASDPYRLKTQRG